MRHVKQISLQYRVPIRHMNRILLVLKAIRFKTMRTISWCCVFVVLLVYHIVLNFFFCCVLRSL